MTEEAWRALAALRKPLSEQEADALIMAAISAEWCGVAEFCEHPRAPDGRATCGDTPRAALRAALTGKKP